MWHEKKGDFSESSLAGSDEKAKDSLNLSYSPPKRGAPNVDTAEVVKRLLLEEMVARVIKINIKAKLRVCFN
jgi:hypothetical protein